MWMHTKIPSVIDWNLLNCSSGEGCWQSGEIPRKKSKIKLITLKRKFEEIVTVKVTKGCPFLANEGSKTVLLT